ncbi:MAG: hypothetical protein MI755_01310 [Sphingomonadales bacterium]|nr:hypothetical protein [Sphingomonadales bacterium]
MARSKFLSDIFAGAFFLVLTGLPASADEDEDEAEEPIQELFQSGVVFPQDEGEIQLSFFPRFNRGEDFDRWDLGASFEYGITDSLQVELELEETISRDREGFGRGGSIGGIGFGAQYSLMNLGDAGIHAAIGGEVEVRFHGEEAEADEGDEEEEEGESDVEAAPYFILAADLTGLGGLHVFTQVGVEFEGGEEEAFVNVGGIIPFAGGAVTGEWNWSEEERYVTPGVVFALAEGWEVGFGAAIGLNDDADDYRLLLNVVFEK